MRTCSQQQCRGCSRTCQWPWVWSFSGIGSGQQFLQQLPGNSLGSAHLCPLHACNGMSAAWHCVQVGACMLWQVVTMRTVHLCQGDRGPLAGATEALSGGWGTQGCLWQVLVDNGSCSAFELQCLSSQHDSPARSC